MGERDGGELQSERFQTTALGIGPTFEPGEIEPDESSVRARERPEDLQSIRLPSMPRLSVRS